MSENLLILKFWDEYYSWILAWFHYTLNKLLSDGIIVKKVVKKILNKHIHHITKDKIQSSREIQAYRSWCIFAKLAVLKTNSLWTSVFAQFMDITSIPMSVVPRKHSLWFSLVKLIGRSLSSYRRGVQACNY